MDATIAPRDLTRLRNNFNIDKRRRTGHHHQVQAHFHPFYELFYLTKGNCRFFLFNRNQVLKDGDILIIPPGEYHYNVYGNGMHDRFTIYFTDSKIPQDIRPFIEPLINSVRNHTRLHVDQNAMPAVKEYLEKLNNCYYSEKAVGDVLINYVFPEFLLFLAQHVSEPELEETAPTVASIQKSVQYIKDNYAQDLTLDMAASEAGLTPTYFSRKFKEVVGTGFRDYVNFVRLGGAASLLRTTQLSIQEISRRCGFNSANYFGDAFRSAYGISPREFRKSEDVQQRAISIDLTEEDADDGLLADAGMNPADDAGRNTADDIGTDPTDYTGRNSADGTGTDPADDAGNRPTDGS